MDTFAAPVGAVSNRTGLECLSNSKIYHSFTVGGISESPDSRDSRNGTDISL